MRKTIPEAETMQLTGPGVQNRGQYLSHNKRLVFVFNFQSISTSSSTSSHYHCQFEAFLNSMIKVEVTFTIIIMRRDFGSIWKSPDKALRKAPTWQRIVKLSSLISNHSGLNWDGLFLIYARSDWSRCLLDFQKENVQTLQKSTWVLGPGIKTG